MTTSDPAPGAFADVTVAAEFDGGDMDCGSGLLLLLTRHLRAIDLGEVLAVDTAESSVPPDLADWARLAGHEIVGSKASSAKGPWRVLVRRVRDGGATTREVFTGGEKTPLGRRLWLYSNFHCNLACSYCCAASSPTADARLMPVEVAIEATRQFAQLGGGEVLVTGGEPFLHPEIGALLRGVSERLPTTVLTNAMVFGRGARRDALDSLDREWVTLQISLDSAGPQIHDRHRGERSHAKALTGIGEARALGFRVRVAATLYEEETAAVAALHALLDSWDIPMVDRIIRPVAEQGFAEQGQHVGVDTLEPEPTLTADGVWWHPVAVTDATCRVAETPLPVSDALGTFREIVAVQDAARSEGRRTVFRCA